MLECDGTKLNIHCWASFCILLIGSLQEDEATVWSGVSVPVAGIKCQLLPIGAQVVCLDNYQLTIQLAGVGTQPIKISDGIYLESCGPL